MRKRKEVEQVSESNLFGTTKTSFQSVGEARLVIKHSRPVDPNSSRWHVHTELNPSLLNQVSR